MLGEVVGLVVNSWGPLDLELSLAGTIADLPEAHIHRFGALGYAGRGEWGAVEVKAAVELFVGG